MNDNRTGNVFINFSLTSHDVLFIPIDQLSQIKLLKKFTHTDPLTDKF
jgi:hypothetical protein